MGTGTTRETDASIDTVWGVLADGWSYATWVVGASRIRAVDSSWPVQGSTIHHSVGVWPAVLDVVTTVIECHPGSELKLRARALPFGSAHITGKSAERCARRMLDDLYPASAVQRMKADSVQHAAVHPRNREALRRLAMLAERASA